MKLPKFSEIDNRKILAIAALILAITVAAVLLSSKFSKIKVLGVELETNTEQVNKSIPKQPNWDRPNRDRKEGTRRP
jgi:hypothetical protein